MTTFTVLIIGSLYPPVQQAKATAGNLGASEAASDETVKQ
jgi:hypothetical protein